MNKKILILIGIIVFIVLFLLGGYLYINTIKYSLSNGISLNKEKYKTSVGVESNINFILYIDKDDKVSNIIFLDNNSVKYLYNKNIEGKNIEDAVKEIIEKIKDDKDFYNNDKLKLINYGDNDIYKQVESEFNKEFVIYGINKNITPVVSTLGDKYKELTSDDSKDSVTDLYNYSLDIVNNSAKTESYEEEDLSGFATNLYNKLVKYANNTNYIAKDDPNKLDITTVNITNNYDNQLYVESDSWYYVENNKVFAYVKINYNSKDYEYCFNGDINYTDCSN